MDNNTRYPIPLIVTIIVFAGLLLAAIMYVFQADADVDVPRKDAMTNTESQSTSSHMQIVSSSSPTPTTNEAFLSEGGQNLKENGNVYAAAVKQYGEYRIQLENCRAFPFTLEVPNGTDILLDGFSPDPQRVTIGEKSVMLEGYDAEPIRIEADEPTTLSIHCEAHGNTYPNIGEVEIYL